MSKGLEGLRMLQRGAEDKMIREEEKGVKNPEYLIEAQRDRASESVDNFRLVALLEGEILFNKIVKEPNPGRQLQIAKRILENNPLIHKYLPTHIEEIEHQEAFIVGIAIEIQKPNPHVN